MTDPLQVPICVDDHGSLVYRSWATDRPVASPDVIRIGAVLPGVTSFHVVAADEREMASAKRRQGYRELADFDRNCNTCANLKRTQHAKCRHGFLEGECDRPGIVPHDRSLRFHPEDPMFMPCYQSRWRSDD